MSDASKDIVRSRLFSNLLGDWVTVQTITLVFAILLGGNLAGSQAQTKPNILVIVLDDARYDMFQPNGGPSFFNTPSINRIADEGINFKLMGVTTSLCTPSRASIYTGLYAHHHGAVDEGTSPKPGLTYVSSILQNNGYYTGFVGKWLYNYTVPDTPVGFNYWAVTDMFNHKNPTIKFNDGTSVTYQGYDAVVYTDLAIDFLKNKVPPGKPWVLFLFHRVPHDPVTPMPSEDTLYQHVSINFPDNFSPYQKNFPSYLYPTHEFDGDSSVLDQYIRDYYETCHAAEYSVDSMLSYLEANQVLDSTLIIFSSDNGLMEGEHDLTRKLLSYDESLRVPLFIRYPKWFTAGTVVEDEWAANIDIAPTLLDAAGIPDTFNMDGISLHQLAEGLVHRPYFFYENYSIQNAEWEAVRSLNYEYIYSYCSSTCEEFFDLINDPEENNNLIFNPAYASLIQNYRQKRNSLRLSTNDTIYPAPGNCSMYSAFYYDADSDGYGNPAILKRASVAPAGYVLDSTDCNDVNASVHPGAPDVCNGIDDNCDGYIDENSINAIISPAGTITICKGTNEPLTANGGAGLTYQWLKNGNEIPGETSETYGAKKAGDYQVRESNNFGCIDTSGKTIINTLDKPAATITPLGSLDICATGSVVLHANSGAGYSYQWKRGNDVLSGKTNQTYTTTENGVYKVVVTDSDHCSKMSGGARVTNSCKQDFTEILLRSASLSVYPNPTSGKFMIDLQLNTGENSEAIIQVVSMIGQVKYDAKMPVTNGMLQKEMQLNEPTDGMYFVKVIVDDRVYLQELMISQ